MADIAANELTLPFGTLWRFDANSEGILVWAIMEPTYFPYDYKVNIDQAAYRMADIRESIRTFIDDLPNVLSTVKDCSMAFDDSSAMHKCSADLYVVSTSSIARTLPLPDRTKSEM